MITGGAGFIGSHMVDQVKDQTEKTVAVDNLSTGKRQNLPEDVEFENFDVAYGDIGLLYDKYDIDTVFHFAANADVPRSVDKPSVDFISNAQGTFNIIEAARQHDVRVIYASTAAVYGEPQYTPMDESHPLNPSSPYGASKLAGERAGFAYHNTYDHPFTAIRIFNTFGPRQPRYVMYDFLKKIQRDDELEVLGTGEQIRDFCYVKDTVRAFEHIWKEEIVGDVFNIAGDELSISELAEIMVELFGPDDMEIVYTGESWDGDIKVLSADTSKIEETGHQNIHEFDEGLRSLYEWFKIQEHHT